MVSHRPFRDNGERRGYDVKIYQLDKGCCNDCSFYHDLWIGDVRCYYCGSKDYRNIIDFAMLMDIGKKCKTMFCYNDWQSVDSCFHKYQRKKRLREYAKQGYIYKCYKSPPVEDVFREWFMWKEICTETNIEIRHYSELQEASSTKSTSSLCFCL